MRNFTWLSSGFSHTKSKAMTYHVFVRFFNLRHCYLLRSTSCASASPTILLSISSMAESIRMSFSNISSSCPETVVRNESHVISQYRTGRKRSPYESNLPSQCYSPWSDPRLEQNYPTSTFFQRFQVCRVPCEITSSCRAAISHFYFSSLHEIVVRRCIRHLFPQLFGAPS